jgi:formyl-CoA transferase
VDILNAAGVPTAPVFTVEDVLADPHVAARRMIMTIDDPEVGAYQFVRSSPILSSNPALPADPAPNLGQHTRQVLEDLLGYAPREVERLIAENVVQASPATEHA